MAVYFILRAALGYLLLVLIVRLVSWRPSNDVACATVRRNGRIGIIPKH